MCCVCALPVGGAVSLQYGCCLVSRQTADLHQLSGEHFSHRLTLEEQKHGFINTLFMILFFIEVAVAQEVERVDHKAEGQV